ncbi:hypothetical protein GCM10007063_28910 [Lentibacillus kapialis]|uniref:Uncharacterized protein n=1 Tax=Lentibacillus kapialis TaxID=340214 RepID=A0A917Q0P9_9BACI|nr:hypothetical protein [Lentibacillus kapialis]GGK04788.1 hypothetical protein GCM10007063_28910 [Lentibacillus kapialis]
MTRPLLIALVLIAYMIYVAFKHKETWKQLSIPQITGVLITFIGIVSASAVILFYGSRYITSVFSGQITAFVVQFLVIIVIIAVAGIGFAVIAGNITNGIIPILKKNQKK